MTRRSENHIFALHPWLTARYPLTEISSGAGLIDMVSRLS
jgi:hypothetical protein